MIPAKTGKPIKFDTAKIGRRIEPETLLEPVVAKPMIPTQVSTLHEEEALQTPDSLTFKSDGALSVGQVIRMLRKEKGVSQEELAQKAHIDRTTIARLECGIFKSLSMEKLGGVAAAIGIDLKTLLLKAEPTSESASYRGNLSRIAFSLDYSTEGFRIDSLTPKRKEFFFGKIEIQMQKTVASDKLPHPEQIYLHCLEGKILLTLAAKEFLLKSGDCFAFVGLPNYEFYNPDQFKVASALFITYPSFLVV